MKATGLWWLIFTALALVISFLLTGVWGSAATLRPDGEGNYPELVATFLMASLVVNLISTGLVSTLALPILRGQTAPTGLLPMPGRVALVQTVWALVLTALIVAILAAIVSTLAGFLLPLLPLGFGLVAMPILITIVIWLVWLAVLRVFIQPLDLQVDPAHNPGLGGTIIAAALFGVLTIILFLLGTAVVVSPMTEAIVASIVGWVVLMLALATVAVRVKSDE